MTMRAAMTNNLLGILRQRMGSAVIVVIAAIGLSLLQVWDEQIPQAIITFTWLILKAIQLSVGIYCSFKLSPANPGWVRLMVLWPAFAAVYGLQDYVMGFYSPTPSAIINTIGTVMLSFIVASRFTGRPWLDLRVKGHEYWKVRGDAFHSHGGKNDQ